MSDFDKRFDRALDAACAKDSEGFKRNIMLVEESFTKGADWTKPALKAAYEALQFYSLKPFKALGVVVVREPGRMSDDFSTYNEVKARKALKEIEKLLEQD